MGKKLICISGTPGTGKSTLAKAIVRKCGYQRLDISKHYPKISYGYTSEKNCYDVNLVKFKALVQKRLKESRGLVIDSHISHLLPKRMVDVCIVMICPDLKKLKRRLQQRGYSPKKVRENLDAEIFQVCLNEAKEGGHRVIVVEDGKRNLGRILAFCTQKGQETR